AGFRPEPLGIRHLVAVARRRARAGAAEYAAAAAVDDVDAHAREFARERDAVLESPARAVDGRQAHEERLARRPLATDVLGHLDRDAHPGLEAAAVLVVALVGMLGEELVDQVAVGGMEIGRASCREGWEGA